jgi:hypothetical protein
VRNKIWVYNPQKRKIAISDKTKSETGFACERFIEEYLRPRFVRPFSPKNKKEQQCVDFSLKQYRNFIYFKAVYKDLRPDVIAETYEYPIARLRYMDKNFFHLAYYRHTEEWWEITYGEGNSLEECFDLMRKIPNFHII